MKLYVGAMFEAFRYKGTTRYLTTNSVCNPPDLTAPSSRLADAQRTDDVMGLASTGISKLDQVSPSSARKRKRVEQKAKGDNDTCGPPGACTVPRSPGLPEKLGDSPLRLVLVGHNPSEVAWQRGHYYANPSNRMWPILIKTGLVPPGTTGPEDDDQLPTTWGVGFTDVGTGHPGTDSSQFSSRTFIQWRQDFYHRLRSHVAQACKTIGCSCGTCGSPCVIAFTGKRHYQELMKVPGRKGLQEVKVETGPQSLLPPGWPLPPSASEVWVLTSTSGAAAMTTEVREAPYRALSARLAQISWPREGARVCGGLGTDDGKNP